MSFRVVGFAVSGLLHLAVLLALLLPGSANVSSAPKEALVPLNLEMFEQRPEPVPALPEETVAPEVAQAEPEEPEPAEPEPVEPEPAEPELPPLAQTRPEPLPPAPAPEARPEPRKSVKPRPQKRPLKVEEAREPAPPPAVPSAPVAPVVHERPAPQPAVTQIRESYLAQLVTQINQRKFYPRSARRRSEEGRVLVRFVIQKDGRLENLVVMESSGSRRLDEAALKTLRRVTPFQPIPDALAQESWAITVPIEFSLRG